MNPIYTLQVKHTLKKAILFTLSNTESVHYFENKIGKITDTQDHHYPTVIFFYSPPIYQNVCLV